MKTIATLIFVLLIGFTAQAKDAQVVSFENGIKTASTIVKVSGEKEVARLYRSKHSLVKKELNFTTKKNSAKLA